MSIPFKYQGQVIIAYRDDGRVPEVDNRDQCFDKVADYLKTIDEPEECVRFLRFDRWGYVADVTDAVINGWLKTIDILQWNEDYGCPALVPERSWENLVKEEIEYAGEPEHVGPRLKPLIPEDDGDYAYQAWRDSRES